MGDIFHEKRMVEFLKSELSSVNAKKIFAAEFLDFILKGIKSETKEKKPKVRSTSLRSYAKGYLPLFLIKALRKVSPPAVDRNVLAFRVFLIIKMNEILEQDSLIKKDVNNPG